MLMWNGPTIVPRRRGRGRMRGRRDDIVGVLWIRLAGRSIEVAIREVEEKRCGRSIYDFVTGETAYFRTFTKSA